MASSSLLSFWWRRRQSSSSTIPDCPPPMQRFSSTGEDSASSTRTTLQDETQHQQEDYIHVRIPIKQPTAPWTPDGLKPRRTRTDLAHELGIVGLLPPSARTTTSNGAQNDDDEANNDDCSFGGRVHKGGRAAYAVLPPIPSRWMAAGGVSSPPVSTSSFYGHSSDGTIAVSPHLYPGHARTAVGAIVALQQQQWTTSHDSSSVSTAVRSVVTVEPEQRLLPPPDERPDWQYPDDDDQDDDITSPSRDDNVDENEQPVYYALDDHIANMRSPEPSNRKTTMTQRRNSSSVLTYSPLSTGSSLLGSPSSRAGLRDHYRRPATKSEEEEARHILLRRADSSCYDFGPLAGATLVTEHNPVNLSAMSGHESVTRRIILNSGIGDDDDGSDDNDRYMLSSNQQLQHEYPQLDGALRKGKMLNQRRAKEALLLSTLERLQDDLQVIADVEANAMNLWLSKTPLHQQGLLTGFSQHQRNQICDSINVILKAMQVAEPEEFFLSPSQLPQYVEPHDDLCNALQFCQRLVAYRKSDDTRKGQWKFRARSALGLFPPESPEIVRGGDTSLFSLPSEQETPMTSNVSLTTTITSAVLTPQRLPFSQQHFQQQRTGLNGLAVRRTMEVFTGSLQQMTTACVQLLQANKNKSTSLNKNKDPSSWSLSAQESVRFTGCIKRAYMQLLSMDQQDLKAVVGSFELQEDADENLPPLSVISSSRSLVLPPPLRFQSIHSINDDDDDDDGDQVFMVDDLRRQMGSADYGDQIEPRDGPDLREI